MREIFNVYNEGFEEIARMVGQGNYKGAFVASANLTLFSTLLDYDDGILVSEVLEGVFSQVGPLAEDLETEVPGLFVAGESAGFYGIGAAAISGTIALDSALRD